MIPLSLIELVKAADGKLFIDNNEQTLPYEKLSETFEIKQLVTDSRSFSQDKQITTAAFLALKGPHFNGHEFVLQVIENGCRVVIVDHPITDLPLKYHVAQIVVKDTRIALGKIAATNKANSQVKAVAITGSSGKTTVKEMVSAILARVGRVLSTEGNFNNDIGVPLTLLRLDKLHDYAVVELGANHKGEIAYTVNLVKPNIALINNIAAAHLEGFGDLCGVAQAKGEIFQTLNDTDIAIYNQESKHSEQWKTALFNKNVKTFSCSNDHNISDFYSSGIALNEAGCALFMLHTPIGNCSIELSIPGQHNVCNAVAAASIAIEFGASLLDISSALIEMAPVSGRLNTYYLSKQIQLIDDSYNANVESVKVAIDLLSSYPTKQILILGDMGELGEKAINYHQEIGEYAQSMNIDVLLTIGELSQYTQNAFNDNNSNNRHNQNLNKNKHFEDRSALLESLFSIVNNTPKQPISILVKGSRSAHMEYVVQAVINWHKNKKNQYKEGHS